MQGARYLLVPAVVGAVLIFGVTVFGADLGGNGEQVSGETGPVVPAGPSEPVRFTNQYGPVEFSHKVHEASDCSACHPLFDQQFDDEFGYSLRAHEHCIGCHRTSGVGAECGVCHQVRVRSKIPFDPAVLKTDDPARQAVVDRFYARRSVREFTPEPIDDSLILDLLKVGMAAPSAGNWQPWEFLVVRDEGKKRELASSSPFTSFLTKAPLVLVVLGKRENEWARFDCALASENILLAASQLGLGGVYTGLDPERDRKAREILAIPDDYVIFNFLILGKPARVPAPHTKYNPARVHFETFKPEAGETVIDH